MPFSRPQSDSAHTQEGTGLGLALSKSLIELHGGSIVVDSKVGIGTCITVRFPPRRLVA